MEKDNETYLYYSVQLGKYYKSKLKPDEVKDKIVKLANELFGDEDDKLSFGGFWYSSLEASPRYDETLIEPEMTLTTSPDGEHYIWVINLK